MSPRLQIAVINCWQGLPGDSGGVPSPRPSEMVALNYDGYLSRDEVELYFDILHSMTNGYRKGYSDATKHKEQLAKRMKRPSKRRR